MTKWNKTWSDDVDVVLQALYSVGDGQPDCVSKVMEQTGFDDDRFLAAINEAHANGFLDRVLNSDKRLEGAPSFRPLGRERATFLRGNSPA